MKCRAKLHDMISDTRARDFSPDTSQLVSRPATCGFRRPKDTAGLGEIYRARLFSPGARKARYLGGGKKEVSTGRLVHYILVGLMHRPQSRRAHLRDRLPQALTHPVASHTCDIREGTNAAREEVRVHIYTRGAGSRSPIDRARWNLTRSARHKNQSAFKPRAGENLAAERERNRSANSTMVLVNELRNDSAIVKER